MRLFWLWVPVLFWAAAIFSFSTEAFSSTHTSGVVLALLRWVFPHAQTSALETIHLLLRKTAHYAEYLVFSLLLLRALRGESKQVWRPAWALWAVCVAAAYAGLDELHQALVPDRMASFWDFLLDISGAVTAQVAAWLALWRRMPPASTDVPSD